jgi:hypothetical protein
MMNLEGFERKKLWPEVLFQHLSGRTEENHEKPQAGWLVYQLRIRPGTCQIQVRNITD